MTDALGWPRAVVFDLDGTLVDSVADIASALNATLCRQGLAPFSVTEVRGMMGGGLSTLAERALSARAAAYVPRPAFVSELTAAYEQDLTTRTVLYDGARELLETLARDGRRLGLCSNKVLRLTEAILERLDIARYFGAVVGEGLGLARKPDPAPLLAVLDRLGAAPVDAVMVGDSAPDVECARRAGVVSVAVTFGYSKAAPEELGAAAAIDRLQDLPACLRTLAPSDRQRPHHQQES